MAMSAPLLPMLLVFMTCFHSRLLAAAQALTPPVSSTIGTNITEDALILLEFKRSITHDPFLALSSWQPLNSTNSSSTLLKSTSRVCHGWRGVSCNNISGRVEFLNLSGLALQGSISPALGSLLFLGLLDLSSNLLSGPIPSQLAHSTSLWMINLGDNLLSGSIPPEFGRLPHLTALYLHQNNLTGTIPTSLANAGSLTEILLDDNHLSGSIPVQLFQLLQDLTALSLANNSLSGVIPELAPGSCRSLQVLSLFNNQHISGSLPISLLRLCKNLTILILGGNKINGSIPDELGVLPRIQSIALNSNQLHGSIPSSLGNATTLQNLFLTSNSLTGHLPPELCNNPSLQGLYLGKNFLSGKLSSLVNCSSSVTTLELSDNLFEGSIPPQLGSFINLDDLNLAGNKLTGHIPSSLGNCSKLAELQISVNNLTGHIPYELGHLNLLSDVMLFMNSLAGPIPRSLYNCSRLQVLHLSHNQLTGVLQPDVGGLKDLQLLNIQHNQLSGSIPTEIGECKSLQSLFLSMNKFSGSIPSSIGSLIELQQLALGGNALSQPLPTTLANLKGLTLLELAYNKLNGSLDVLQLGVALRQLQVLHLQVNQFTGTIPETIGNCKDLIWFKITDNLVSGTIPPTLGKLQSLNKLSLGSNMLVGSIPEAIGRCSHLLLLDLAYNKLNGSLPSSLGKLSNLALFLNISHNELSGPIPEELGTLQQLQSLDLSHNHFTGNIPDLSANVMLQSLDLSSNHLTGSIPDLLGHLLSLSYLNLSHNVLQESIPTSLSKLPVLQQLDVSDNELMGPIPDSPSFRNLSDKAFMGNPGLCGNIIRKPCMFSASHSARFSHHAIIACSVAAILIAFVTVGAATCYMIVYRGRTNHASKDNDQHFSDVKNPFLRLSEDEIKIATNAFSTQNVIGCGGFSTVYRATLQKNGLTEVAVKVLNLDQEPMGNTQRIEKVFIAELQILGKLKHRNLVKVLGYCSNLDMKAVIMEYIPNGNLEEWLHSGTRGFLTWRQRLNIAIGIAHGLVYLHYEYDQNQGIVHCDLKPSNILLDEEMQPRIADFGIARIVLPHGQSDRLAPPSSTMSSIFQGSIGYMAPEYGSCAKPGTKGDEYSYGVMLLELVTGRKPTSGKLGEGRSLREWVVHMGHNNCNVESYADPALLQASPTGSSVEDAGQCHESAACKQMELVLQLGIMCTRDAAKDRPCMRDVLQHLQNYVQKTAWTASLNKMLGEHDDDKSKLLKIPPPMDLDQHVEGSRGF